MEIKGRECEEVKIGEDKLYFLTAFKGKEYRKVLSVQVGEDTTVNQNGEVEINASKLIASVVDLFPIFCVDIIRGEEHITPSVDYLDELDVDDYLEIQNILSDKMSEITSSKKVKIKSGK